MRHLALFLLLIFISCKNDAKSKTGEETETQIQTESDMDPESGIDESVNQMWKDYIESNPVHKDEETDPIFSITIKKMRIDWRS